MQACRLDDPDVIYLNKVGTFGVGSASYWWHRLFAALGRTVHYLSHPGAALWQLLFADDAFWAACGPNAHIYIVYAVVIMQIFGAPFSLTKFAGGVEVDWVGYWIDVANFGIGLSERRAAWMTKWLTGVTTEKRALAGTIGDVLGRLSFAANAIDEVKPFLGPAREFLVWDEVFGGGTLGKLRLWRGCLVN